MVQNKKINQDLSEVDRVMKYTSMEKVGVLRKRGLKVLLSLGLSDVAQRLLGPGQVALADSKFWVWTVGIARLSIRPIRPIPDVLGLARGEVQ